MAQGVACLAYLVEKILNIIISFAGLESQQEERFSERPYALQRLAGGTILDHVLAQLQAVPVESVILVVSEGAERVASWVEQRLPGLEVQITAVDIANGPIAALRNNVANLDAEQVLLVSGNYVAEADYRGLVSTGADVACLIQMEADAVPAEELAVNGAGVYTGEGDGAARWAGACWFRRGTDLASALSALASQESDNLAVILEHLREQGRQITTHHAFYCLDTRSVDSLLQANARLLQLGHGSQDAIERSYAEDFTVLPPVFMHETAVVQNVVIGPFVNLEAQAVVRDSVVRNSLIGVGSQVTDAILDGSLIGDKARVSGRARKVVVGDEVSMELQKEEL
jgi:glucose-1-phosphate thymidylyltransferase